MKKVADKALLDKLEKLDIDVLGFPYKIQFVQALIEKFNVCGCSNVWGSEIEVDPAVSILDVFSCIFHEIIELMFRKIETKCEHDVISKIETFLMSLIINNPELMEMAVNAAKTEGKSLKNRRAKKGKRMVKGSKGEGWT